MTEKEIIIELIKSNLYRVDEDCSSGLEEDYNIGFQGVVFSVHEDEWKESPLKAIEKIYSMIMEFCKKYETPKEEK
jgi:hypothetical protein